MGTPSNFKFVHSENEDSSAILRFDRNEKRVYIKVIVESKLISDQII